MRGTIAIALGFLVAGCSENARETGPPATGGTLVIATTQDPGALFPPYILTVAAKQIAEQLYDYLADVGTNFDARDEKSYRAELAKGWRWSSDSMNIAFQLDPRARWHDGRSVTAGDVRFTFDLNKDTTVASRYISSLGNIDSVSVPDSLTAVFWFHRRVPTQFLDAAAQLLILPAHQLERIPRERLRERLPPPIGSGRFRLRRWDKGTAIEIVADTGNYRGRAILDRVIWSPTPDFNAAFARLMCSETARFAGLDPRLQWCPVEERKGAFVQRARYSEQFEPTENGGVAAGAVSKDRSACDYRANRRGGAAGEAGEGRLRCIARLLEHGREPGRHSRRLVHDRY